MTKEGGRVNPPPRRPPRPRPPDVMTPRGPHRDAGRSRHAQRLRAGTPGGDADGLEPVAGLVGDGIADAAERGAVRRVRGEAHEARRVGNRLPVAASKGCHFSGMAWPAWTVFTVGPFKV